MRPAFILLALTALAVARPLDAATNSFDLVDSTAEIALARDIDTFVEQAWQDEIASGDMEDGRRGRRLKKFIKRLVKKYVKKALKKEGGGGAPDAPADGGGAPADGGAAPADGSAPADGAAGGDGAAAGGDAAGGDAAPAS